MKSPAHTVWPLALLLLLGGCGSCQRTSETPDTTSSGAAAVTAKRPTVRAAAPAAASSAPAAPEAPGRILAPTLGPTVGFGPTGPAARHPEAPPPAEGSADADEAVPAELDNEGDCIVIIDADPDFGEPPLSVSFSVESQCTGGTPALAWDFGDNSPPSNDPAPIHVYDKPGEYTARVLATAADGTKAADEIDITVEARFQQ
ncbi:MAG: PKD domain-containing protein [Deltaproteobacteria bacterium]|nr:PKD domain-containing protein [Deltaproteobacteria bacterium]MBI3390523.1 PKD domain-containing protein [Deltaproteobacteria bacterium]